MSLSKNSQSLLRQRYCHTGEQPKDVFTRVAKALSLGDSRFEKRLNYAMYNGIFLPNSPTLRNAGTKKQMLSACFVLPVYDNIESIADTMKATMLISKAGGGCGYNFSAIRAVNSPLRNGGTSSGVVSFMSLFDSLISVIKQGGFRRGALMGILNHNHSEIIDFIKSKLSGKLTNFNISVMVTDEFMKAVEEDSPIHLINPSDNKVTARVQAKSIFDFMATSAWINGDPGILFYDTINASNPLFPKVKINAVNPCGESCLADYMACCLGSINLSKIVKRGKFDFEEYEKYLELATRALLNNNAVSSYPLPEITKMMKEYNPIGVGVFGVADAFIKMGIYYDSEEALKLIDQIGETYKRVTDKVAKNCFLKRVIAPTGSLSIIADCSSGIEPIFDTTFERHLSVGVMEETRDIYKSKFVRTAHQIAPEWHIKIQAQWQKWIDSAVSKTINMPYEASIEDVKNAYMMAWKAKCKGVTIFRNGSKGQQVLVSKPKPKCSDAECSL